MTLIQLQDVTVELPTREQGRPLVVKALDGVSLTVRHGEVMGVIGPTGCGKSTLLRAVAGLLPPQSGRILYDGQDLRTVPPHERGVGMVFQDYALYPHYSVLDNLSFYLKLRRRQSEVPIKVQEAAQILGVDLQVLLGRMPSHLSIGQRQQVAVARCLIRDPKVFLMDEPFANIDAAQRQHARVQLKRLLDHFRVTTLYVTHDQQEAAALCTRIAVMDRGQVRQVDTYAHLLAWPRDLAVAEFVSPAGSHSVEGARLEGHFACPAFSVPLLPAVLMRTQPGQALVLRVPPAAVSRVAAGIEALVELSEPLPMLRHRRLTCQARGATLAVEVPYNDAAQMGDRVHLAIDPEQVQVFDAKTGVNLALAAARA